ncbi:alanyl-tRNA editing protein [Natrononativus amylolyticus]|uniref:alanyl-tRNA editing protein n=1 Tax=Natrononativus amylolyticus TaxID=2963434 RepID=UPI0020CDD7F5|nr:alanine--tRNA ligase-related protein [Natrononativus amylolyticus]
MSGQRAAAEPYTTRFETEVTAVDGTRIWLETSYFYAESGGQPADRGTIGDVPVDDVQIVDGEHVHVLAEEPSFRAGHRVMCSIDWAFRMYCMRAHTASHILYGAGRRLLSDLGYGGFDIGEEKVRVDLETTTTIGDETLVELDELVNRAVWESRPVSWEELSAAEAREHESIAFNEATEEGAMSRGRVRVVTIGAADTSGRPDPRANGNGADAWDVAACGGTHVRNTREVGPVTVLDRSNPGEGLTRIELAVGPRAIERRTAEKRATLAGKDVLGAAVDAVPAELERLRDERESLAGRVRTLEGELVAQRLDAASPVDRDDGRWLLATVSGVEPDTVGEAARARCAESAADVVVVAGETGQPFAVVASAGSPAASAVVDELTAEFGGGGGGSETAAQAGGFDASPAEIVGFLE